MKTSRKFLAALGLPLLLAGCFDANHADDATPGGEVDGMTVNNDDGSDRLDHKNDSIPLDSVPGAVAKRSASGKVLTLTLKAEIKSPVINGDTLQATSVHLAGGYAYVSYNMRGEPFRGGVDVLQIKSGSSVELRSQVLFDSTDVHALHYNGDLYLAQGDARTGAMIEKLTVSGGKIVLQARQRAQLGSFVATSVTTDAKKKVFVTTGNTGHLYALDTDLKKTDSVAISEARWVDNDGLRLVVARGMPARLGLYGLSSPLAVTGLGNVNVGGANVAESKTTVRAFPNGKILVAAGDSGVRIVNRLTGLALGAAPRVKIAGLDSMRSVTNAADGSGTLIYASNGEAGIYALETSTSLSDVPAGNMTIATLGKLRFANFQSANHVAFDGNTLVVAAGKGGVKVVSVKYE